MIELIGITPGTRLRIIGDITAEVIEAVNDEWVRVRLLSAPTEIGSLGSEELCHVTDVVEIM